MFNSSIEIEEILVNIYNPCGRDDPQSPPFYISLGIREIFQKSSFLHSTFPSLCASRSEHITGFSLPAKYKQKWWVSFLDQGFKKLVFILPQSPFYPLLRNEMWPKMEEACYLRQHMEGVIFPCGACFDVWHKQDIYLFQLMG